MIRRAHVNRLLSHAYQTNTQHTLIRSALHLTANFRFFSASAVESRYGHETDEKELSSSHLLSWKDEMHRFWEQHGFSDDQIDVLVDCGNGKPPTMDASEISFNFLEMKHLRDPFRTQRHMQSVQKLFPTMNLIDAIDANPYLLTLPISVIAKRKENLIALFSDLISNHPTTTLTIGKQHFSKNPLLIESPQQMIRTDISADIDSDDSGEDAKDSGLDASSIRDYLEWGTIFESVPQLLSHDVTDIIKHLMILRRLFGVNKAEIGLLHTDFIEFIEVYPSILRPNHKQLLAKFRFIAEFGGPAIIKRRSREPMPDLDLVNPYQSTDLREKLGYKIMCESLVPNASIFDASWDTLSRLKFWLAMPSLHKNPNISLSKVISLTTEQWLDTVYSAVVISGHGTTPSYLFGNPSLSDDIMVHVSIDDSNSVDFEEFTKTQLRPSMTHCVDMFADGDETYVKKVLKKDKPQLRKIKRLMGNSGSAKAERNKQQNRHFKKLLKTNRFESEFFDISMVEKLRTLESWHGRLCQHLYTPTDEEIDEFLVSGNLEWPIKSIVPSKNWSKA